MGSDLRELRPELARVAREFVRLVQRSGYSVRITSVVRSRRVQRAAYERFLSGAGPVVHGKRIPAAPPGRSAHECGIAWDMVLDPPDYDLVGAAWRSLGFRWLSSDPIHFDFLPSDFTETPTSRPICEQLKAGTLSLG